MSTRETTLLSYLQDEIDKIRFQLKAKKAELELVKTQNADLRNRLFTLQNQAGITASELPIGRLG